MIQIICIGQSVDYYLINETKPDYAVFFSPEIDARKDLFEELKSFKINRSLILNGNELAAAKVKKAQ